MRSRHSATELHPLYCTCSLCYSLIKFDCTVATVLSSPRTSARPLQLSSPHARDADEASSGLSDVQHAVRELVSLVRDLLKYARLVRSSTLTLCVLIAVFRTRYEASLTANVRYRHFEAKSARRHDELVFFCAAPLDAQVARLGSTKGSLAAVSELIGLACIERQTTHWRARTAKRGRASGASRRTDRRLWGCVEPAGLTAADISGLESGRAVNANPSSHADPHHPDERAGKELNKRRNLVTAVAPRRRSQPLEPLSYALGTSLKRQGRTPSLLEVGEGESARTDRASLPTQACSASVKHVTNVLQRYLDSRGASTEPLEGGKMRRAR